MNENFTDAEIETIISDADLDDDGEVNFHEFVALMINWKITWFINLYLSTKCISAWNKFAFPKKYIMLNLDQNFYLYACVHIPFIMSHLRVS